MSNGLPPLEHFLSTMEPGGAPDVSRLPQRDSRTPGRVVGRGLSQPVTVMNIVDDKGNGFALDLEQVTQAKVARAVVPAHTMGSSTDAAVATFHRLASGQTQEPRPRNQNYTSVEVTNLNPPPPPQRRRAVPMGQAEYAPVAPEPIPVAVRGPGYVEQGGRQLLPNLPAPPQTSVQVAPPTQQVTYEIPGYGPLDTFYHQVIRTGENLVLVFDKRHVGQKSFPRHSDASLGMRVHDTDKLFVVKTTGIEFDLDTKALCILEVVTEGSYRAYTEQGDPLSQQMSLFPFPPELTNGEDGQHSTGGDPSGADSHDDIPGF